MRRGCWWRRVSIGGGGYVRINAGTAGTDSFGLWRQRQGGRSLYCNRILARLGGAAVLARGISIPCVATSVAGRKGITIRGERGGVCAAFFGLWAPGIFQGCVMYLPYLPYLPFVNVIY